MASEATYKLVKVLTKSFEFLWGGVCEEGVTGEGKMSNGIETK